MCQHVELLSKHKAKLVIRHMLMCLVRSPVECHNHANVSTLTVEERRQGSGHMNYWWSFAILQLTINPELTTYSLCVIQPPGICVSNEQRLNNELVDYLNKYGGVYGGASEPHPALSLYLDVHKSSIISVVLRNLWDFYTNWWFTCSFVAQQSSISPRIPRAPP